ncbi:MAG: hypothetical protein ACKV2U_20200 [Bryobacteraceae bacterium]
MKRFEEDHLGLLQNIEFVIVEAWKSNRAVTDFDVTDALDALTRQYSAEAAERQPSVITLEARAQAVYQNVKQICEWRLGRTAHKGGMQEPPDSVQEIISALRRIMKSVGRWSGRGGKRGYLEFVKDYLP